jgi:hypothetical protein
MLRDDFSQIHTGSGSAPQSPRVCRFETAFQIGSQVETAASI